MKPPGSSAALSPLTLTESLWYPDLAFYRARLDRPAGQVIGKLF